MAWYNPATWGFVDKLQGQSNKPAAGPDPKAVTGYINGRPYNYAGDWLGPAPGGGGGGVSQAANDWNNLKNSLNAQIRSLQNAVARQPKLASFDVMANWRNAQSAAERAQNPVFEQKLNQKIAEWTGKRDLANRNFNLNVENINTEKANTMEENQVARTRTSEDVAQAIEDINKTQTNYQTDEGRDFDANYRATAEQLGASGQAGTGLGRQQTYDMMKLRNVTNQRQLDEFQGQREAKQLFKTRTFEDLLRGDNQATALAQNKIKGAQFDLDEAIQNINWEEQEGRFDIEQQRLEAVLRDTQNYEKSGIEQFLAGLAGQGYSASDIAYNRSIYA